MLHGKDLVFDQALSDDPNKLVSMKELKKYWFEHLLQLGVMWLIHAVH